MFARFPLACTVFVACALCLAACGEDGGSSSDGTGVVPTPPAPGTVGTPPAAPPAIPPTAPSPPGVPPADGAAGADAVPVATDVPPAAPPADGAAIAPTFATLQSVITQAPCFGAGCHNDDQNPLDLRVDEQLHARVTSRISESCDGLPVVSPGNPEDSALVRLLKGPCGQTPRMPLGCVDDEDANCVPAEYIAAIEQWIASGAPQ